MKIAVIADEGSAAELRSRTRAAGVEWQSLPVFTDLQEAGDADAVIDLEFDMQSDRMDWLSRMLPKPVMINSVLHTLEEINLPFIRINAWPGFIQRPLIELVFAHPEQEKVVKQIFEALDWSYQPVKDVKGMISARIIAMIINEAYYVFEQAVSTREEIDLAMKLGTNYPYGPFEWSRRIGLGNVHALLTALAETDSRYSVSMALEKEALLWHSS